jgi:hypothetical protein
MARGNRSTSHVKQNDKKRPGNYVGGSHRCNDTVAPRREHKYQRAHTATLWSSPGTPVPRVPSKRPGSNADHLAQFLQAACRCLSVCRPHPAPVRVAHPFGSSSTTCRRGPEAPYAHHSVLVQESAVEWAAVHRNRGVTRESIAHCFRRDGPASSGRMHARAKCDAAGRSSCTDSNDFRSPA